MMNPLSPAAIKEVGEHLDRLRRAREIDPEAFKPLMVPHYTGEQLARQEAALRKVREGVEE